MRRVLDEHYAYVTDAARIDACQRAIDALVRPGDHVLDLGCGTGVLGLLACRAGAGRVSAIESSGLIEAARRIARDNGCGDRITHLRGWSHDVTLPSPADLLVCDQLGPLGVDYGIVDTCHDAAARLLRPGATLMPSHIETHVAPVEAPASANAVSRWRAPHAGFTFEAMREKAANTTWLAPPGSERLLAEPRTAFTFELGAARGDGLWRAPFHWRVDRAGVLHGLLGWFVATLSPGVSITNGPDASIRIDRPALLFPIDEPIAVDAGDTIDAELSVMPRPAPASGAQRATARRVFVWRVRVTRDGREQARVEHTTLRGLLVSEEDLT